MKLSIDPLGPNGFPRTQLANALQATFSATNYNNILASNNNINNNSTVEGGISNSNSSNSMISSNNNNNTTTTTNTTSNQMMNQGLANKQFLLQYLKAGLGLTKLQQQHQRHHHSHSVNDTNAVQNNVMEIVTDIIKRRKNINTTTNEENILIGNIIVEKNILKNKIESAIICYVFLFPIACMVLVIIN